MIIIGCSNSTELAKSIARIIKAKFSQLFISHFPDGELMVQLKCDVKRQTVVLVQSMVDPNEAFMEILFAARTAYDLGAKKVVVVAPYLAYMREDKRFHKGECISAKVMAGIFNRNVDKLVTVDPHLHRYHSLQDIFTIPAKRLTAVDLISAFIKKKYSRPIIIGPDEESFQWAEHVARIVGCRAMVLKKKRIDSTNVEIDIKEHIDFHKKQLILVDDMISTGHTMMEVIKDARKMGASDITCLAVHGLFTKKAYEKLRKMKVKVVTCNTITHKSNKINIAGLIATSLK